VANHPKNRFSGITITSTWGSDLLVYGNIKSHQKEIEKVLSWTNILTAERRDDFQIAAKFGFKGEFQAPIYITVGNRTSNSPLMDVSNRNSVVIKGYQDSHGRALNALQAVVETSREVDLSKITFYVYSASKPVQLQMELFCAEYGIDFIALPRMPKKQLMQYFDEARVYIGLAISDGLSTSMVEAMAHGVFPIQSKNSAASDFLVHGLSGGVVDPWDISGISTLLKLALTDDLLVDQASKLNQEVLLRKYNWDEGIIRIQKLYSTPHQS
jgi:glycosyltransferase involved in cell wall biosynthesis